MVEINKIIIPEDGAIIQVGGQTTIEEMTQLRDALCAVWTDRKFILYRGDDIAQADEETMNKLGWFRKEISE